MNIDFFSLNVYMISYAARFYFYVIFINTYGSETMRFGLRLDLIVK